MDSANPSHKSKKYRDKLRNEIRNLEELIPIEKASLQKKMDSQTVYRLAIAFFRTKAFVTAAWNGCDASANGRKMNFRSEDIMQLINGFLMIVTSDGTILYTSANISEHLGFSQLDLAHRCIYGITHPDDHMEVKATLEKTIDGTSTSQGIHLKGSNGNKTKNIPASDNVSMVCRMKTYSATRSGYLKVHVGGVMKQLSGTVTSTRTSSHVFFTLVRPHSNSILGPECNHQPSINSFWTKHTMDFRFKEIDGKAMSVMGFEGNDLEGESLYHYIHPDDLHTCANFHTTMVKTNEIKTAYFRMLARSGKWYWLHVRGKVVFKNSKQHSLVLSHSLMRAEDSAYIQQEVILRNGTRHLGMLSGQNNDGITNDNLRIPEECVSSDTPSENQEGKSSKYKLKNHPYRGLKEDYAATLHSPHGECPSSWHRSVSYSGRKVKKVSHERTYHNHNPAIFRYKHPHHTISSTNDQLCIRSNENISAFNKIQNCHVPFNPIECWRKSLMSQNCQVSQMDNNAYLTRNATVGYTSNGLNGQQQRDVPSDLPPVRAPITQATCRFQGYLSVTMETPRDNPCMIDLNTNQCNFISRCSRDKYGYYQPRINNYLQVNLPVENTSLGCEYTKRQYEVENIITDNTYLDLLNDTW